MIDPSNHLSDRIRDYSERWQLGNMLTTLTYELGTGGPHQVIVGIEIVPDDSLDSDYFYILPLADDTSNHKWNREDIIRLFQVPKARVVSLVAEAKVV